MSIIKAFAKTIMAIAGGLTLLLMLAAPATAAPLSAYGHLPQIEDVQLSPDGTKLAVMNTRGEARSIVIFSVEKMELVRAIPAGNSKVRTMRWADNDTIIFMMSVMSRLELTATEFSYGSVLTVSTGKIQLLVFNDAQALNQIYGEPQVRRVEGKTQIFVRAMSVQHGRYAGEVLVRSEPGAKRSVIVKRGDFSENDWLMDEQGKVLVETVFDHSRFKSHMVVHGPKGRRKVEAPDGYIFYDFMGLSADGRSIVASYGLADGESDPIVGEVSIDTGEWSSTRHDSNAVMYFDPLTVKLFATRRLVGEEQVLAFLDPADDKFWKNTQKAFAGSAVTPVSLSGDRRRLVVLVDSPTEGPAYALVDHATGRAEWLGDSYSLEPTDIAPVTLVNYKAADGLDITGYLTVPHGAEPKDLPLIVLPHGGPAARDLPGFDWWSQALASRGYAVLRPNFRGSDGYGPEFRVAGHGEWGRKMQTDLSDGVRHLAAQGAIDPKRVCIAGASYGGYAALAGAALDRGVYRCAASIAGPSDLGRMLQIAEETGGKMAKNYWTLNMGVRHRSDRNLEAISPVRHAHKVDIPLLLIHGKDDTVVHYEQTTRMAEAMKKAGKPVEVVTLVGEDHYLSKSATRLQMLTSLVSFLEKHNPPGRAESLP